MTTNHRGRMAENVSRIQSKRTVRWAGGCCMGLPWRLRDPLGQRVAGDSMGWCPFLFDKTRKKVSVGGGGQESMESCVETYFTNFIYVYTYIHIHIYTYIHTHAYIFIGKCLRLAYTRGYAPPRI